MLKLPMSGKKKSQGKSGKLKKKSFHVGTPNEWEVREKRSSKERVGSERKKHLIMRREWEVRKKKKKSEKECEVRKTNKL
jgi:hypothetical protein